MLIVVASWLSVSATACTYFSYLAESLELIIYTHLYVSANDAYKLFVSLDEIPIGPELGLVATQVALELFFEKYSCAPLRKLGALIELDRPTGLYVLKFRGYLAHLPTVLIDMHIEIVRAEIVRINSAPTRARAGYYEDPKTGFTAVIERVFPTQHGQHMKPIPLHAQNITVSGRSLKEVQDFNTKTSTGSYSRFLVNAFE